MRFCRFVFVSFVTMIFVCYVYHKSIISYIIQHYHYTSDMLISQMPFFAFGDTLANKIESMRLSLFESNTSDLLLPQYSHSNTLKTKDSMISHDNKNDMDVKQIESYNNTNNNANNQPRKLVLQPKTRFLLIGDSLMQGIGLVLPRMLKQHNFLAKNIAKQSTGLTYQSFFNWEQATREAFNHYSNIGVLVVCLGANDPWNMPKVRFGTDLWEQIYRSRIQAIFDIAKANNAIVVWYAVPAVKNVALNKKLLYLNSLYKDIVYKNGGIFLSSDAILQNGEFSAYLKDSNGKSRLVRTPDGIHFTVYGASLLAQMLIDIIDESNQNQDNIKEISKGLLQ